MKIINRIKEKNTIVKVIIYLFCFPLFMVAGYFVTISLGAVIEIFYPPIFNRWEDAFRIGSRLTFVLWLVFGFKLFKKNKAERNK